MKEAPLPTNAFLLVENKTYYPAIDSKGAEISNPGSTRHASWYVIYRIHNLPTLMKVPQYL